jgi:hypothetical protein
MHPSVTLSICLPQRNSGHQWYSKLGIAQTLLVFIKVKNRPISEVLQSRLLSPVKRAKSLPWVYMVKCYWCSKEEHSFTHKENSTRGNLGIHKVHISRAPTGEFKGWASCQQPGNYNSKYIALRYSSRRVVHLDQTLYYFEAIEENA